ncbi:hypothetical protein Tco_1101713 [Tanacetum coccineum]
MSMASLDRRLNLLYAIKECLVLVGNLPLKQLWLFQREFLKTRFLVPYPTCSQQTPLKLKKIYLDCGDPVSCYIVDKCSNTKELEEVLKDFQDTSKSSDDDTNFVNQEPFVVKQGPGVNSSQSPPQIDHECCYECGDSLDGIFCQRCTGHMARGAKMHWIMFGIALIKIYVHLVFGEILIYRSIVDSEDSTITYTEISNPLLRNLSDVGSTRSRVDLFFWIHLFGLRAWPYKEPEHGPHSPIYVPYVPEPLFTRSSYQWMIRYSPVRSSQCCVTPPTHQSPDAWDLFTLCKGSCVTTPWSWDTRWGEFADGAARRTPDVLKVRLWYNRYMDDLVGAIQEIASTTLEGVNQRSYCSWLLLFDQEDEIIYSQLDDARYDRALLRARVNMLYRDRPFHRRTAILMEEEARLSRAAWATSRCVDSLQSDTFLEGISLWTYGHALSVRITELQAADRRRQSGDLDCWKADYGDRDSLWRLLKK